MRPTGFANKPKGVGLLETMLALFLLGAASLLVVVLFHSGLQRARLAHVEAQARIVAAGVLDELRSRAAEGQFRLPDDISNFDADYAHPDFPHLKVKVRCGQASLLTPSSGEESLHPAAQKRSLNSSVAKVEVLVSWDEGGKGIKLVTLLEESPRTLDRVVVNGSGPIAAGESATFSAQAFDTEGKVIEDALFVWWVDPLTATGTVSPAHNSRTAVVTNQSQAADGTVSASVGECQVAALCAYDGREIIGSSNVISMVP